MARPQPFKTEWAYYDDDSKAITIKACKNMMNCLLAWKGMKVDAFGNSYEPKKHKKSALEALEILVTYREITPDQLEGFIKQLGLEENGQFSFQKLQTIALLVKKPAKRNPYNNRKIGKAVEYDCVKDLKSKGMWARRNPDYMQNKKEPIDVFCWNPYTKEFWGIQCKRHRKGLFSNHASCKDEVKRILEYCKQYQLVPYLCYRSNGLHYEIIN